MRLIKFIPALVCAGILATASPPASAGEQGRGRGQVNQAQKQKGKDKNKENKNDDRGDVERTRFEGLDRDGDGVVTRAEWRGNDQSFSVHDWNRDGVLSGAEVRAGAERSEGVNRYASWDNNRDGVLSLREWRGSRDEFVRLDNNRDGVLTRFELGIR